MVYYTDSEVGKFHPLCGKALEKALIVLGKDKEYEVKHHDNSGPLQMDFAIQNNNTLKYICVIEVKKTPADVQSMKYQNQVRDYVIANTQMIKTEKPFYIMTNLEMSIAFRYNEIKTLPYQHILKPGIDKICNFKIDNEINIVNNLEKYFEKQLGDFFLDKYEYLESLEQFFEYMANVAGDERKWKSSMAILMYQYILGSFQAIKRKDLKYDVRYFKTDVKQICDEIYHIDFEGIFQYDAAKFLPNLLIEDSIINDVLELGKVNISADLISDSLHEIVSKDNRSYGEVATDLELANLVSVLALMSSGKIDDDQKICDPAAGSGNLISSAIDIFGINANQLKANDKNVKLIELLSARLGLRFPASLLKPCVPSVTTIDIVDIEKKYFDDVAVVLLNPPFLAGFNDKGKKRRKPFYDKITKIKGSVGVTDDGQMNLAAVFVELLCYLTKPGTTIACIFPKSYLTSKGKGGVIFRKFLLNKFGLHTIFNYPPTDLFQKVSVDTCVLVGKVMQKSANIKMYSSIEKVSDINLHKLQTIKDCDFGTTDFISVIPGVDGRIVAVSDLETDVEMGWQKSCLEMMEAISFIDKNIDSNIKLKLLSESTGNYSRGNVGNDGGSDLVFLDSKSSLYNKFAKKVKFEHGIRRIENIDSPIIKSGNAKFLDFNNLSTRRKNQIVNEFILLPQSKGSQAKDSKTVKEWKKIAEKCGGKPVQSNSVLVPTKVRPVGKVFISKIPLHLSTNLIAFSYSLEREAELIASYMLTIFYQLECEISCTVYDGMRKNDEKYLLITHVPDNKSITDDEYDEIHKELPNVKFIDLQNPTIRKIDQIWAKILFATNDMYKLNESLKLLKFLANRRNS